MGCDEYVWIVLVVNLNFCCLCLSIEFNCGVMYVCVNCDGVLFW